MSTLHACEQQCTGRLRKTSAYLAIPGDGRTDHERRGRGVAEKDCQRMRTAQGGSDAPRSVCLSWHFALATVPKVTRWTEAQRARILAARFDYGPLAATRQSQPTPAPNKAVRDGRTKRRGRGCCTLCARVGVVQAQTPRAPPADSHAHPSATGRQRSLQRDGTKVSAQRSAAERSGYRAQAGRAWDAATPLATHQRT